MHKMAVAMDCSIFIKNAPNYAGLGMGGEGPTSFTIASPTGEGMTTARSFTRKRRCVLAADLGYTAPLDCKAWGERLARLLADTPRLDQIAERARHWVEKHYAWSRLTRELIECYRWVLAGCPAEHSAVGTGHSSARVAAS